jgi:hypothetical protein
MYKRWTKKEISILLRINKKLCGKKRSEVVKCAKKQIERSARAIRSRLDHELDGGKEVLDCYWCGEPVLVKKRKVYAQSPVKCAKCKALRWRENHVFACVRCKREFTAPRFRKHCYHCVPEGGGSWNGRMQPVQPLEQQG